ncbi:unnamed protein product [Orchesella dallaii]|uniref:Potassium channel domain-containing protein n=1 Tax=Orchesella dallaii TaxID=48710 RepID=A0ABP1Q721_9HEXA
MAEEDIERTIKKAQLRKATKDLLIRLFILFLLSAAGGFLFRWAEGTTELEYKCGVKKVRRDFVDNLWQSSRFMNEDDWKSVARRRLLKFEDELHAAYESGMDADSGTKTWNFMNAVFYSMTIITTIGYGHISPITFTGQLFTMLYALIGIPIFTIVVGNAGKVMTLALKLYLTSSSETRKAYTVDDEFNVPLKTGLSILTMYSLIGTAAFAYIESEWGIFSSFYFVFITTSTVGFGDYFPSNPVVAVMSSLYFVFGLALCSMVLGLIQETLDAPINNLTKKTAFILGMGPEPIETNRSTSESEEHIKGD